MMIKTLKESGRTEGGKAHSLGEMLRMGLPVPDGFVVTTQAFTYAVGTAQSAEDVLKAGMPDSVREAIAISYTNIGAGRVAVRSSAMGEDGATLSFAGQHSTFLNIESADSVCEAVLQCWASLYNERAIEYRAQHGVQVAHMAVVVQEMIDSRASGVMFTANPKTGEGWDITIEAIHGLGELIVSGEVTPDRYIVEKPFGEINLNALTEKTIRRQTRKLTRDGDAVMTGIEQKLTDDEIIKLATYGMRLETEYGWPQDIEFATTEDGVFILQSRPITTLQVKTTASNGHIPMDRVLAKGIDASGGVATGKATWVDRKTASKFTGGVLVAQLTTPDMLPAMRKAVAVVTEQGGLTCHAAIVCREMGIPAVVGVGLGKGLNLHGSKVVVDGNAGIVYEASSDAVPTEKAVAQPKTKTLSQANQPAAGATTEQMGSTSKTWDESILYQIGQKAVDDLADALIKHIPESPAKVSVSDFEAKSSLPANTIKVKVIKWPEGKDCAKVEMHGKYDPADKTWIVDANHPFVPYLIQHGLKKI